MGWHRIRVAAVHQTSVKQLELQQRALGYMASVEPGYIPLPTEWVSPSGPRGASALSLPLRIFSSLGNGGKNRGGGGWPGSIRSGMFGGAEVNELRL